VVPNPRAGFPAFSQIGNFDTVKAVVAGRDITFLIEKTRPDCFHACTVADIAALFDVIPAADWYGLQTIVFRQPTRKQSVFSPVWGRLQYHAEIITRQNRCVASGPVVQLEAIEQDFSYEMPSSLSTDEQLELARLRSDGHRIVREGTKHIIHVTPKSARHTQLYRTMLHEIGHWIDWNEKVEMPAMNGADRTALMDHYFARPISEREAFAHRYAANMSRQLSDAGKIPF
jgi:hypothetical protein